MARTDDRRAALMFYHTQSSMPVPLVEDQSSSSQPHNGAYGKVSEVFGKSRRSLTGRPGGDGRD
jgi:hypothetical protein